LLVKFHSHGTGRGSGPIDYLLGRNRDREDARTLRGDPEQQIEIIDSVPFTRRYTSGVLSFEEENIKEVDKDKIMDSAERALLPGLSKDQYSITWVEHRDKDRLELNFVIANVELQTGKRLQPYYHAVDMKRIDTWKNVTNFTYKLSDPNDPLKQRNFRLTKLNTPQNAKAIHKQVTTHIDRLVDQGLIENRADLLLALKDAGLEIGRETKNYISIVNPAGKRNIKLEGTIYERDYDANTLSSDEVSKRSIKYREEALQRTKEDAKTFKKLYSKKAEYNRGRYPRATNEMIQVVLEPSIEAENQLTPKSKSIEKAKEIINGYYKAISRGIGRLTEQLRTTIGRDSRGIEQDEYGHRRASQQQQKYRDHTRVKQADREQIQELGM
jgi:hypothetical protein